METAGPSRRPRRRGVKASASSDKKTPRCQRREADEPVHIGSFLRDFQALLPEDAGKMAASRWRRADDSVGVLAAMDMPLSLADFDKLKRFCSPDKLDVPNEPPALDIESVRANRYSGEDACRNRRELRTGFKYKSSKWLDVPTKGRRDLRPRQDVVLVVRIYEPVRRYSRGPRICNPPPVFLYDVAVLGSQTLAVLRDVINCVQDWAVLEGVTDTPAKQLKAKDVFKSGFMYIERVFYNDGRHPRSHDYSAPIRQFAEGKGQGPFLTATMEDTKLADLALRFGYPYLYQHQGDCKHIIVFIDARLLHESDSLVSRNYPYHLRIVRKMSHLCVVCKLHTARWVTHDNDRTCIDYCYFCDTCFRSFNFIFRRKVGRFRAYRYYDRAIVL